MKPEKWKKAIVSKETKISEVINALNEAGTRIILICENKKQLIGVVGDSDIRRALLRNISLDDEIHTIMTKNPSVAYEWDSKDDILNLMKNQQKFEIPILNILNEVCDLKVINELLDAQPLNNQVVLMAGGLGTRLHPITKEIPKPLVPINGKPIIQILIDSLAKSGLNNIHVAINYKGHMIKDFLNDVSIDSNISFIEEKKRLGTAGALSLIENIPVDPMFVLNSDILTTIDYNKMLDFHNKNRNAMTVAVKREKIIIPFGVIEIENERVQSVHEKPEQFYFANVGVYIINPELISLIPEDQYYDMPSLINKALEYNKRIGSFLVHEYWKDIGKHDELEKAQVDIIEKLGHFYN